MVLWGGQDELLPAAGAGAWAGTGAAVDVIDGAGHLLEWDAPEEVASRLVRFLG